MKAASYRRYGGPEVIEIVELPDPVPGAHELVVRMSATAVGVSDGAARSGRPLFGRLYFGLRRPKCPVLGWQFVGVVDRVGAAVTRFQVGERVFGTTPSTAGGHAELILVPDDGAVLAAPDGLADDELVAVIDGALTALPFYRDGAKLQPGQRVLVNGATGVVGVAAVQLAKHFGAHVTAVCRTGSLELARSLGADEVIDFTREDFTRNGLRYDVVFDVAAASTFSRSRNSLTPTGIYLSTVPSLGIFAQPAVDVPIPRSPSGDPVHGPPRDRRSGRRPRLPERPGLGGPDRAGHRLPAHPRRHRGRPPQARRPRQARHRGRHRLGRLARFSARRSPAARGRGTPGCRSRHPRSRPAARARAAGVPRPPPAPTRSARRAFARVACTASGACAAIRWASSRPRSSCSPCGTTSCTSPIRCASAASKVSPVSIQRIALPHPAVRGKRIVAPPNGRMPRATSSCAKLVESAATTMSLARASSMPRVRQVPCTAITTGLVRLRPSTCQGCSDPSGREPQALGADSRGDVGEVESGGEVVAVREDESDPQLGVAVELAVGEGELLQHPPVRGVPLLGAVEADQQDVAVAFDGDPRAVVIGHCRLLC